MGLVLMIYELSEHIKYKSLGVNKTRIRSCRSNVITFEGFSIKTCPKNASSTILNIHWEELKKVNPQIKDISWEESFSKYIDYNLIKSPKYNISNPMYIFYRDPIERFISASNMTIYRSLAIQPKWVVPANINDWLEYVIHYNLIYEMDVFWPQTLFFGCKYNLKENVFAYKLNELNSFLKEKNLHEYKPLNKSGEKWNGPLFQKDLSFQNLSIIRGLYYLDYDMGWY